MRYGDELPKKHDLSTLRILGSVGEPINPEAWMWYYKNVGKENCPIMDTWWQTETGMFMITPVPVSLLKPGSCGKPFPGIQADVVDKEGNPVPAGKGGFLAIKTLEDGLWLMSAGIVGGMAVLVLIMAYRLTMPSKVSPFEYFGIPFSFTIGWFIFGEAPFEKLFPGALFIVAAGLLIIWRERSAKNRIR